MTVSSTFSFSNDDPRVLKPSQLIWLAGAIFVVSAGYGALMPLLPSWLQILMGDSDSAAVSRHVGYLSGVYTAGVLIGAPLWGSLSDHLGRSRILLVGSIGYVISLLPLLRADLVGVMGIYALRVATGFFVAAVLPVVPALVAEFTPTPLRAKRFAWLGAISLLGVLLGPSLNDGMQQLIPAFSSVGVGSWSATDLAIAMSAALGAIVMLGLMITLPEQSKSSEAEVPIVDTTPNSRRARFLWLLNAIVMFVLAGFELSIVLLGQQDPTLSKREVALMFAECSLVMLGINLLLFSTKLLERFDTIKIIGIGLVVAIAGLALLALPGDAGWMYLGVSLTSAGTGLALPTISYMAAASDRRRLGATMGGLTAAAGLGQTLGSVTGGWLFAAAAQTSFGWLAAALIASLLVLAQSHQRLQTQAIEIDANASTPSNKS